MDPVSLFTGWIKSPLKFVNDVILHNSSYTVTKQQEDGLIALGKLVTAKIHVSKGTASDEEKELSKKMGISIQSGHGTGKDAFLAWAICWFLSCFPMCKIPCTAPTADQLDAILWSEIVKWIRNSKKDTDGVPILSKWLTVQNRKVFFNEGGGKEWFAMARTTNPKASSEEQAETLAGFHEDFMMIIGDEASGLPDAVFKPLEGGLTGKVNLMLMAFNPTRNRGFAIESQQKNRKDWICLHWNSEDSEIVTREFIDRMARKYGKDSNPYRIRVRGLPPLAESDALIPWDWIQDAVDRDIILADDDPLIFGVDVGAGGDHSTILRRQGPKVQELKRFNTKDTMVLTGHVSLELNDWENYRACCVDNIGIGLGVFNRLRELGHSKVFAVDVRGTARNQDKFPKLRDELWWKLREKFEEKSISIPNDDDLISQLSIMKWKPEGTKNKVLSKNELGVDSPNDADALMMTMFINDAAYRRPREWEDDYEEAFWKQKNAKNRGIHGWMGV